MPGLAKEAPVPIIESNIEISTDTKPAEAPSQALSAPHWEGLPIDMIRYFGQDMGTISQKAIGQLRDINEWSKDSLPEDTIGNRLRKLRGLESKLGAPGLHETKIDKLWNWVKMDFNIRELRKRQEAFER